MDKTPVKLGPLALILTVIVICLTMLALLSVSTASADLKLSERAAQTVKTRYALETEGQEFLAGLLAEQARGEKTETFSKDGMQLTVSVSLDGNGHADILKWAFSGEWDGSGTFGGSLWDGTF